MKLKLKTGELAAVAGPCDRGYIIVLALTQEMYVYTCDGRIMLHDFGHDPDDCLVLPIVKHEELFGSRIS